VRRGDVGTVDAHPQPGGTGQRLGVGEEGGQPVGQRARGQRLRTAQGRPSAGTA
jgi:hypothetical protein